MNTTFTGVLDYRANVSSTSEGAACELSMAVGVSDQRAIRLLRIERWRCKLPDRRAFVEDSLGSSETRGLFGGIDNKVLGQKSEASERAISDCLTGGFRELVELPDISLIVVRGPCLPKSVGRFLSLRPPSAINVMWLSALGPARESNGIDEDVQFGDDEHDLVIAWDQERLVNSFTFPEVNPRWLIEFLDLGSGRQRTVEIMRALRKHLQRRTEMRELRFTRHCAGIPGNEPSYFSDEGRGAPEWLLKSLPDCVSQPEIDKAGVGRNISVFPWRTTS